MTSVPSKGITAEVIKKFSQKSRVGFNMLGINTLYQNVISSNCEIRNLREAWHAIRGTYDSKKPAVSSQYAIKYSNCLHMPDKTVEQFIYGLNDMCARMVNDHGEAMKRFMSSRIFATNLVHLSRLKQDGICHGQNTAPASKTKPRNSPIFFCFEKRGKK